MNYEEMLRLVYQTALDVAGKGPGWSQESAVLQRVAEKTRASSDQATQQLILTCWHDLFAIGALAWGYNLDNPNAPFFHVPADDRSRERTVHRPAILLSELRSSRA